MFNPLNSSQFGSHRVAYVVKRYPRYSETFIVNEILAHEAAGLPIEVFSIRPPIDTHFQNLISQVRAPVHYLPHLVNKATDFWQMISDVTKRHRRIADHLSMLLPLEPSVVATAISLADACLERKITHMHAHFATSAADVAWLAHQLTGIPFTLTAHAKDIFHEDVDPAALARTLTAAKATITVSDFNVDFLKRKLGSAADRVERIYNGLNLEEFGFQSPGDRPPTILAIGRLVEKKGFDVLIDACAILAERKVDFRCVIIGDGPLSSDLHSQCAQLGLSDFIDFLGPQPQHVVKASLQDVSVFAAPCVDGADGNRDGMPTVLLEAMALGTPCVSTPVTGIPEIVIDQQTGLLVPQRDPTALADAIERLLSSSHLRTQLAMAARKLMNSHFDIRINSKNQREVFGATCSSNVSITDPIIETVAV